MNRSLLALALLAAACAPAESAVDSYLYVWAGDSAGQGSDFLAVVDADTASPRYGRVIGSVPTGVAGTHPHHTEDFVSANGHLLANGHNAGRTWLFDLNDAGRPKVIAEFGDVGGYAHPHSFIRTADGNVLASFQYRSKEGMPAGHEGMAHGGPQTTGGIVAMNERGVVIRTGSAADTTIAERGLYPYSVLPIPGMDRAVSTTTDMGLMESGATGEWIQFWRLSDLKLLKSVHLTTGPNGTEHKYTGEPRLLPDGKSVYVHTFGCGLYLVRGIDTDAPTATLVQSFNGMFCGVPILTGKWWLQPVPADHALLALDVSDPEHPREVTRLDLPGEEPHWLAIDPSGRRLVVNSGGRGTEQRLYVINFDPATGALALDAKFHDAGDDRPGISMKQRAWPHGWTGTAAPHGTVFSR